MAQTLIIVDSPAKGKVFEEYYEGKAATVVMAAPPVQPIHAVSGGRVTFKFNPLTTGKELIETILAFDGQEIYLALDGDPRSQYLGWLISHYIGEVSRGARSMKRLDPAGLRPEEIAEAAQFVVSVEEQQGFGFYARALFDAVLGRHLNRLIGTNRGPGNLPLQLNSLTTLFLLQDRELEIRMFTRTMKWQVVAELSFAGHRFTARLEEAYDVTVDGFVKDSAEARRVVEQMQGDVFEVDGVERSNLDIHPPAPYQLLELLHDAVVLCGIGPQELLGIVRKLHHGVEVKGKTRGLISSFYSSRNANTDEWILMLREQVTALFGENALGPGDIDLESGMIFPLYPELSAKDVAAGLNENEVKIYDLIRSRAIASQMKQACGENIRIEIGVGPESLFLASFHSITEQGFLKMYQGRYSDTFLTPCPLAAIEKGQELHCVELIPQETAGVPAERYTFETLFVDLADFSIAPDPVNIFMIQGMINAGYLSLSKDGYINPGKNIVQVTGIVNRAFPRMQGINLSAYIEQTIAEAVSGRKDLDYAVKQFEQTLMIQGKSLVKAKLPSQLKPRTRASSSIIKQPDEEVVAGGREVPAKGGGPEAVSKPKVKTGLEEEAAVAAQEAQQPQQKEAVSQPPEAGAAAALSAVAGQEDERATAVPDQLQVALEPDQAEAAEMAAAEAEDATGIKERVAEEEVAVAETMEESAFLAEDDEEWPDELKTIFEEALREPPQEEALPVAAREQMEPQEEVLATDEVHPCQVCGKPMLLKKDRFGKYWSCSGFPACRHSESYQGGEAQSLACPLCSEGTIVNKRTPSGKTFYVCLNAECEFMAWSQPHYIPCQACDSPYLVEKKSMSGKMQLKCPRAGCDFSQPLVGGGGGESDLSAPRKKVRRVRRVAKGAAPASGSVGGGKRKVRVVRRKK